MRQGPAAGGRAPAGTMRAVCVHQFGGLEQEVGPGVSGLHPGEEVFGLTNARLTGAHAEDVVAQASMVVRKPARLSHVEAAAMPGRGEHGLAEGVRPRGVDGTRRMLVHGAAGNVGADAVQFARRAGAEVLATAFTREVESVRSLRADQGIDVGSARFEEAPSWAD
jgi:NADPH:quinone reductase-like Zn-dependent oxidoreductase